MRSIERTIGKALVVLAAGLIVALLVAGCNKGEPPAPGSGFYSGGGFKQGGRALPGGPPKGGAPKSTAPKAD